MGEKLWVFSLDALGDVDAPIFERLPGFKTLMEKGSYVPRMRGVYPTLTYPSHASIISGRPPSSHRIVNNRRFQPNRKKHSWFWYEEDIHGDTLFKAAKRAKKKVAAFLWPVSASAKIDSNFAEIFPTQEGENQIFLSLRNSTLRTMLPIEMKFGKLRDGVKQPQLDNYTIHATEYLINKVDPDLIFIHLLDVDTNKHHYSTQTPEIEAAIGRIDEKIQQILAWREARPDRDEIDLVFLSDHSQIDTPEYIYPLTDFLEAGFIVEEKETVPNYVLVPHSAGGSCYVYGMDASLADKDLLQKSIDFLKDYAEKTEGIEALYFKEDLIKWQTDTTAFAMLEAKRGYCFSEYFGGTESAAMEAKYHLANHGYHPDKEKYDAVFFGLGPSFKEGYRKEDRGNLLNIAPTLARIQGLDLENAQGKMMDDLLTGDFL